MTTLLLPYEALANVVLALHVGIVLFVIGGLVLILLGNGLRWRWVNGLWFRLAHVAAIGVVVAEAWFGIVCPLTTLEMFLRGKVPGAATYGGSFVEHWLQSVLYFEAPEWVFTTAYSVFGSLVVAAWWFFPPRRSNRFPPRSREG